MEPSPHQIISLSALTNSHAILARKVKLKNEMLLYIQGR